MLANPQITICNDGAELAAKAATLFRRSAVDSVCLRQRFNAAVSGGSTPRPMHCLLGQRPWNTIIPWPKTHLYWVDERCVASDHPDSNYAAARDDFLKTASIPGRQIHPMAATMSPALGARAYQQEIAADLGVTSTGIPRFDIIFLGLGTDGHTASLFPGQTFGNHCRNWIYNVKGGDPNVHRITFSAALINNARQVVFLVTGKAKANVVAAVLTGSAPDLPASAICPNDGRLVWLIDREAGAGVKPWGAASI